MDKKSSGKKSWLLTPKFYGVVLSLLLAIVGVAAAIINVANVKNDIPDEEITEYTVEKTVSTTDAQANANATGVPDERDKTTTSHVTANDLNRPYTGYYLLPLNSNIVKDYSDGDPIYSETMKDWRTHDGIDVEANIGDNAIAIQDGTVKNTYSDELWGEVVIIEHGNGLTATYCGVKATVENGAHIEQGQVIGTVVMIPIEAADGVHIHLETEVSGKTVSPVKAMNLLSNSDTNSAE